MTLHAPTVRSRGRAGLSAGSTATQAARLDGSIAVDGRLDEVAWQSAMVATGFRQHQPADGAPASLPTELRVLYDDRSLYIGARMTQPGGVVTPLARRELLDASGDTARSTP